MENVVIYTSLLVHVKGVWYNSDALGANKKCANYIVKYVDWKIEAWEWYEL
jgi:hypothetical protein